MSKKAPQKRGPGRPPKRGNTPAVAKLGVASGPARPEDMIEMAYAVPGAFKEVFRFFKKINASDIVVCFEPDKMSFFACGQSNQIKTCVVFEGRNLHHYYCGETRWFSLTFESVEKVFNCIDNSFLMIKFIVLHTAPDTLSIDLDRHTAGVVDHFEAPIHPEMDQESWASLIESIEAKDEYNVSWELPEREFKKTCEISSQHGKVCQFRYFNDKLEWLSTTKNSLMMADHRQEYKNPDKIKLEVKVPKDELVEAGVESGIIRKWSEAIVGTNVTLRICEEWQSILLSSGTDDVTLYSTISVI